MNGHIELLKSPRCSRCFDHFPAANFNIPTAPGWNSRTTSPGLGVASRWKSFLPRQLDASSLCLRTIRLQRSYQIIAAIILNVDMSWYVMICTLFDSKSMCLSINPNWYYRYHAAAYVCIYICNMCVNANDFYWDHDSQSRDEHISHSPCRKHLSCSNKPGTALERLNSQLPTEILPHSTSIECFFFIFLWIFITNYILTT